MNLAPLGLRGRVPGKMGTPILPLPSARLQGILRVMDITPQNVQALADGKDEENLRFRSFLKASPLSVDELDKLVFQTTDQVWAKVDCTACGNCCKEIGPVLDQQDAERLAARLGMTVEAMVEKYLKPEEDPDEAGNRWEMRVRPCPLLDKNNRCTVYEDRPASCRRYPYLHEPQFVFRLLGMLERASTCPIVFEVLERMKESTGFDAEEDGFYEEYETDGASQWPELLETDATPWEAIRALAARLPQDHDLLESVLVRVRELVESGFYEDFNYEIVYLPAALALAAPNLSEEQRRRTTYSLVASLKVAGDEDDELYMDILSSSLEAFGDAPVSAALSVIAQLPDNHFGWFNLWDVLAQTTPQTDAPVRQEVIRLCMDALRKAESGALSLLDAMTAGEILTKLNVPEARDIIERLARESADFTEIATVYAGKALDEPPTPVEQWVESHRGFLKDWYDSQDDELDDDLTTDDESILSSAVDPGFMDDRPRLNEPTLPIVNDGPKVGRNDPCPCGSRKKYKKCCGK